MWASRLRVCLLRALLKGVIAIVKKQEAVSSRAELGITRISLSGSPQNHTGFQG
jgi:hypothetical protein